mgnify:CR=1 FL=1
MKQDEANKVIFYVESILGLKIKKYAYYKMFELAIQSMVDKPPEEYREGDWEKFLGCASGLELGDDKPQSECSITKPLKTDEVNLDKFIGLGDK